MSRTRIICTSLVIAATVYDVIAIQAGGVDASISRWFAGLTQYPVPCFGMGFLSGHFIFGTMYKPTPSK